MRGVITERRERNGEKTNDATACILYNPKYELLEGDLLDYNEMVINFTKDTTIRENALRGSFAGLYCKFVYNDKYFYVMNLHLENKPEFDDLKTLQVYLALNAMGKYENLILCGDLNSTPTSNVYSCITTGINNNEFDFGDTKKEVIIETPSDFSTPLISTYAKINGSEPKETNITTKFQDTLDYIFCTRNFTIMDSLTKFVKRKEPEKVHPIPDDEHPSDHVYIVSKLFL